MATGGSGPKVVFSGGRAAVPRPSRAAGRISRPAGEVSESSVRLLGGETLGHASLLLHRGRGLVGDLGTGDDHIQSLTN